MGFDDVAKITSNNVIRLFDLNDKIWYYFSSWGDLFWII
jgi:hypothetical protein